MGVRLTFTVDGVEHVFPRLTFAEAAAAEKAVGVPYGRIVKQADAGSAAAVQALIWVTLKRTQPTLKFVDVGELLIDDVDMQLKPDGEEDVDEEQAPDPTAPASLEE